MNTTVASRRAGAARGAAIPAGGLITCRPALAPADMAAHHAIRHEVFVTEQAVFTGPDRDAYDDDCATIHLLGCYGDAAAGAVRLFPLDADCGLWQGDRLCVLPPFRVHGLGAPLVRCAVATAGARGGTQMTAHIQLPNVVFFQHLGWRVDGDTETYAGLAHQPMVIALPSRDAGARVTRELHAGVGG